MIDKKAIASVQIFNGLNKRQLDLIANHLQEKTISKGKSIILENTQGDSLYILYSGNVKVTKKLTLEIENSDVEEKQLTTLKGSDLPSFGENGLVGAGKRTASVYALTDCVTYRLTQADFSKIINYDPLAAFGIMKNIAITLAKRLESTDEDVVKLATALSIAVSMN